MNFFCMVQPVSRVDIGSVHNKQRGLRIHPSVYVRGRLDADHDHAAQLALDAAISYYASRYPAEVPALQLAGATAESCVLVTLWDDCFSDEQMLDQIRQQSSNDRAEFVREVMQSAIVIQPHGGVL